MSVTAVPTAKTAATQNNTVTAKILSLISLLAQQNGVQGLDNIFGTLSNQGYSDILAANNNSIFGAEKNLPALPDNVANLLGFQSFGNTGSPRLDNRSLASLSSAQEEQLVAAATSGSVNAVLNMKIPPIPKKTETDDKAKK